MPEVDRRSLLRVLYRARGVYGVGMCLGPLAGGFLADAYGPSTLYLALVVVAFVMMPLTWRMKDTG